MQLRESGIILFCERYDQALKFYTEQIGLGGGDSCNCYQER
jgi:hypothetical protein